MNNYKSNHVWYPTLAGAIVWQVSFQLALKIVKHYSKCLLIKKNNIIFLTLPKQYKNSKTHPPITHQSKYCKNINSSKNHFHYYVIPDVLPKYGYHRLAFDNLSLKMLSDRLKIEGWDTIAEREIFQMIHQHQVTALLYGY